MGQTLAHLRYITRTSAARLVLSDRLPCKDLHGTAHKVESDALRSSGRVCERFTIALPVEANAAQRAALVSTYAEHLTLGIAGYVAAIHDQTGNDIKNPHFHLVCFDTKITMGGRGRPRSVLGMARKNAIETAAHGWACVHNRLMSEWGFGPDTMIDHRSFAARGIDRVPTIHEGPGARKVCAKQESPTAKPTWRKIDEGHTRAEANRLIKEINIAKEKINEQRSDGLGKSNDGHAARGKGGVPWQREDDGSACGNEERTGSNRGGPSESRQGSVGVVGNVEDGRSEPNRAAHSNSRPAQPPFVARKSIQAQTFVSLPRSPIYRGSRVRRIYRELVLIRDALKTRLLRIMAQSPVLDAADCPTHPIEQVRPHTMTRTEGDGGNRDRDRDRD